MRKTPVLMEGTRSRVIAVLLGLTVGVGCGSNAAAGTDIPAQATGGHWQTGRALPVQIAEIAAAEMNGRIYTGGGFSSGPEPVTRWFGVYDLSTDDWESVAALPEALHHFGMATAVDRIWLAGGYAATGLRNQSNRLYSYDPQMDAWKREPDMPGGRAAHTLIALDEALYVAGGTGDDTADMWVYDVASSTWTTEAGPIEREHLGGAASAGGVFVIAGRGFGRGIVGTLESFDPRAAAWTRLNDMPQGCGGCSAATTSDGRIHITGGEDANRTYAAHFVYDPATATWERAADMPTARHGVGAVAVGERFYVIGGGRQPGLDFSNIVEWWVPSDTPPTASPTASEEIPTEQAATSTPSTVTPTATIDPQPGYRGWLFLPALTVTDISR
jgi:N-acetylneuraminic acid mutarotase